MVKMNFIEKMYKKISKWDCEEVNYSTDANGIYNDLEYKISGNKVLDNTFIKGRYETANVALKQRPGVIEFTCDDVTVTFRTDSVSMETVYATINSILEIYAAQFKADKK